LLAAWLRVSLQSFGGGTATFALIRREFVDQTGWIEDKQFLRDWALCQLAPGINLVALTILIGRRTGGAIGVAIALCGLLLPSFAITLALTAAYAQFIHTTAVSNALKGVIPAVAGIGIATAIGMSRPLVTGLWAGKKPKFAATIFLFAACLGAFLVWHPPTIAIVLGAGALGAVANVLIERWTGEEP
jgi:chromate transporter